MEAFISKNSENPSKDDLESHFKSGQPSIRTTRLNILNSLRKINHTKEVLGTYSSLNYTEQQDKVFIDYHGVAV